MMHCCNIVKTVHILTEMRKGIQPFMTLVLTFVFDICRLSLILKMWTQAIIIIIIFYNQINF